MIDHFSKYAVALATSRQDTQTVISCLTKFFTKFGPVERILTDNGRSFISKEFMEFAKTWSIKNLLVHLIMLKHKGYVKNGMGQ